MTNAITPHPTKDIPDDDMPILHGEQSLDEQFTKLNPDHAIGRYVLVPKCKDIQWFPAKILKQVDKYKNDLQMKCVENIKYKVLIGHSDGDQWE